MPWLNFKNGSRSAPGAPPQGAAVAFVVLVCLTLIASYVFETWSGRQHAVADATESTTNLVRSVAQHTEETIRAVDSVLIGLAERLEHDDIEGDRLERLRGVFRSQIAVLPQIKGISFLDAEGYSIVNSLAVTQRINFADRDYFRFHRETPGRQLHIGRPVRSRAVGEWVIPLSLRVSRDDGSFAGVILATLDMAYYQAFYSSLSIGEKGVIVLASSDAIVLVRRPFVEANIGRDLSRGSIFSEYLPRASSGAVWGSSLQDNLIKLAAYRRIDAYPLVVWVALEENEVLADWRANTLRGGIITSIAVGIIGLLGFFVTRQFGLRLRAEHAASAAAREAADSAASYRLLADISTDMIFRLDRNFRRTYVSPASRHILGYDPEEMIGIQPVTQVHPEDAERVAAIFRSVVDGRDHATVTNRIRHRDGHWVWVEVQFRPIRDPGTGVPIEIFGSMRDVTQRKQSEEALRQAEAKTRSHADLMEDAIEALPDGFVVYDADARVAMANRRFREMYPRNPLIADGGATLGEILRRGIEVGEVVLPRGTDPETWIRERLEGHRRGAVDYVRESPGGWLRVLEHKTRDGRTVGIHADSTERKQAQAAAENANVAKSEFLSRMSHELRTPLNAVLGFSQLLQLDRGQLLSAQQMEQIDKIHSGGQHLLNLINEVLDLSGIEAGRLKLSIERVAVADMVADIAQVMAPLAAKTGIALSHESEGGIADVRADHLRLRQILLNLVSNAIKYNRANGTVILAAGRGPRGHVRFSVSDTGPGIPWERRGELFQPFQRLGAEHTAIEGTGIGLAIAKRLVEAMDGEIGFVSTPGEGTRFWVDLPEEGASPSAGAIATAVSELPQPRALSGRKILYVEDNPANLALVQRILSLIPGVTCLSAPTPKLGLELAAAHQPDAIILDINLPEMSGYDVLARLRAMPETRDTPVLALSAAAMPSDIRRGIAAGFFRYLTKPVDIPSFIAAIDEALSGGAGRAGAAE